MLSPFSSNEILLQQRLKRVIKHGGVIWYSMFKWNSITTKIETKKIQREDN